MRWIERTLVIFGLFMLIYHTCFRLDRMISPSMSPTLQGVGPVGDWVLTERVSYWFRQPRRWEVVRLSQRDGTIAMKRVVGLPGENVGVEDQHVQINGRQAPFPPTMEPIEYYDYGNVGMERTMDCGVGYYVLGDDSIDSLDSRYEGVLPPQRMLGRVWLRVWPKDRVGFVNP